MAALVLPAVAAAQAAAEPAAEVARIVEAYLSPDTSNDWESIGKLPGIRWAPLPPRDLEHCLPDGGCYALEGTAVVAGQSFSAMATGARTIANLVYLHNDAAPLGEAALLAALEGIGLSAHLARCPVEAQAGGINWYRLSGANRSPGVLSVQTACAGEPCERFALSRGEELPPLEADQVRQYSEHCAAGEERRPVSTLRPHELLAQTLVALVPPGSGPPGFDWKELTALSAGITWLGDGPKPASLTHLNDPSPMMQTGQASLADRRFSVLASGTATQATNIYLEELGTHASGEHVLGVVYEKGLAVELVRCGPVYTESTNNWYRITSARTRPVMIRQSIRYDGSRVQDSYALRLDGSLPSRDPRDRDPGVNGCR
jgi:hypothetical protein